MDSMEMVWRLHGNCMESDTFYGKIVWRFSRDGLENDSFCGDFMAKLL